MFNPRTVPRYFFVLVIVLLGMMVYGNSFHVPFQFDDHRYIVGNAGLRDPFDVAAVWKSLTDPLRFVGLYTFAWNYHFHKYSVLGYHLVNILIHIAASLGVMWMVLLLTGSPGFRGGGRETSGQALGFWAAVFFLCHPVQTQAVTYISQRFASLAAMFYVLSICCYLKGRLVRSGRGVWFILAALSALLGMFTKQTTLTLPLMILLVELFCFNDRRPNVLLLGVATVFLLIIPAAYSFDVSGILSMSAASDSHAGDIITSWRYFLTQFRVIAHYLLLLAFPIGQNLDYDFVLSRGLFEPSTFLSFISLFFIFFLGVQLRNKQKLISFGIFWFFLTLLVESSVIPIRNVIFEHRIYLPSIGIFIALSAVLHLLFKSDLKRIAVCVVILCCFSVLTYLRNQVWQTPKALWSDVVKKSPNKARAHFNLGLAHFELGEYPQALASYNQALSLKPRFSAALINRGLLYRKVGNHQIAMADFDQAIEKGDDPQKNAEAYHNRGVLYRLNGKIDLALTDFNRALALDPGLAQTYVSRAVVFAMKEQYDLALNDLDRARRRDPHIEEIYSNRGSIFRRQGKLEKAVEEFDRALSINPNLSNVYLLRSMTYKEQEQYGPSLRDALRARELGKNVPPGYIEELRVLLQKSK